jgi:hypothetical protein
MSKATSLIEEIEGVLQMDEAGKKTPPGPPDFKYSTEGPFTEEEQQKLLAARENWKDITKKGEDLLGQFQEIADACDKAAKEEIPEHQYRAIVDLASLVAKTKNNADAMYGLFASGRETMYQLANAWGISTKTRGTEGERRKSADITVHSHEDLMKSLEGQGKKLVPSLKRLLDFASLAHGWFARFAKQGASAKERGILIDATVQFRDSWGSVMFGGLQGIARRTTEIMNRHTADKKFEHIEFAWEHSPEYISWLFD